MEAVELAGQHSGNEVTVGCAPKKDEAHEEQNRRKAPAVTAEKQKATRGTKQAVSDRGWHLPSFLERQPAQARGEAE